MKNKYDSNKDKLMRIAVSFLLAFFLWVYALSATGQTETKQFKDIPVKIINESSLTALGLALDEEDFTVDVKLYGSTLQISQISKNDLTAVVDVSGIGSVGKHSIAVSISGVSENVSISEIDERYISISVSELVEAEKSITVIKEGNIPEGYAIMSEKHSSNIATVYGNEENVGSVATIKGTVDINSTTSDVTRRAILAAYDENGNAVEHVSIVPQFVDVNLIVGNVKEVPVKVMTSGEVSEGYVLWDIVPARETVRIAAKEDVLENTDHITTADIDLSGKSASFSQTVSLRAYDGVMILDNDPVKVELKIEMKEHKRIKISTVRFLNTPEGLECSAEGFDGITAVFSGDKRILEQLNEDDITAFVDLEGYIAGEYDVSVEFDMPEGVQLQANQDIKVRIVLKK